MRKTTWLMMVAMLLAACSQSAETNGDPGTDIDNTGPMNDVGSFVDDTGSSSEDSGDPVQDVGTSDAADDAGTDAAMPPSRMESEPNDGDTVDQVNDLPLGERLSATIEDGDPRDIFAVPTVAGGVYEVVIETTYDAAHLTVIDYGRDEDAPGQDYVKISRDNTLQFVSMGEGGHLVTVRDQNVVDEMPSEVFDYVLEVRELDPVDQIQGAVTFGQPLSGTLQVPSNVHIWTFEATAFMDVVFDMSMPGGDGRLYVVSTASGDWIARQFGRSQDDPNPLLDAPITEAGAMWLVVEDITESGPPSSYTIQTGP